MLQRLTASASLAAALCVVALAASALPARAAQDSNPATPSPEILSLELPPAITLPAITLPAPRVTYGGGMAVGTGGGVGMGLGPGRSGECRTDRNPLDYDTPFRPCELRSKAVITAKPEPVFTEEARRNAVYGFVRLRAVLSGNGEVKNISVIKGLPDGLTERAIKAARAIKFRPAQKDGRAVSQWVTLEYNFITDLDEDVVERRAVILEQPAPAYTEEARRQGVAGKVVLEVALRGDGRAYLRRVVERLPHGLTERAVEAAGKMKFTPAEHGGRKVDVVRRIEYVFAPD